MHWTLRRQNSPSFKAVVVVVVDGKGVVMSILWEWGRSREGKAGGHISNGRASEKEKTPTSFSPHQRSSRRCFIG